MQLLPLSNQSNHQIKQFNPTRQHFSIAHHRTDFDLVIFIFLSEASSFRKLLLRIQERSHIFWADFRAFEEKSFRKYPQCICKKISAIFQNNHIYLSMDCELFDFWAAYWYIHKYYLLSILNDSKIFTDFWKRFRINSRHPLSSV